MTTEEFTQIETLAMAWAKKVKETAAIRAKLAALGVDGIEISPEGVKWWRTFLAVKD